VELKKTEDWIAGIDCSDPAAAVACVAEEFDGWAPELTALITDGETDPVPRPIYALPLEHRWNRVPGVTLLGDAAYLTAPSGEGANLAMYDGAELAKAIAANAEDVEAALLAYETDLFFRAAPPNLLRRTGRKRCSSATTRLGACLTSSLLAGILCLTLLRGLDQSREVVLLSLTEVLRSSIYLALPKLSCYMA
jgi:hypothetical protein